MVGFGGWEMPVSYPSGTLNEHRACREEAVAFDVSHLGSVRVEGSGAFDRLQATLTNDLAKIAPGRSQYTHLLDSDGSVLDDIIVWWRDEHCFDAMPNASNTARVIDALGRGQDITASRAVIAVQGPAARVRLRQVHAGAADVERHHVATMTWHGASLVVAGTGYTGEDGVECAIDTAAAVDFWRALLGAGLLPAGLGARDTLRLEAGLALHGHELGPGITPLQAGLGWVVGWDKGDFRGRDALEAERQTGIRRRLRGITIEGRQPAREGSPVFRSGGDAPIGAVTSGNFSPTLGHAISLAFLPPDYAVGQAVECDVRGRRLPGVVTALPFVARHR